MDRSWGGGGEWWVQVLTRAIHKLDKEPNGPQSTACVSPPHDEAEESFSCGQLYAYILGPNTSPWQPFNP